MLSRGLYFTFILATSVLLSSCKEAIPHVSFLNSLKDAEVSVRNVVTINNTQYVNSNSIVIDASLIPQTTAFALGEGTSCDTLAWQNPSDTFTLSLSPREGIKSLSYRYKIQEKIFPCHTLTYTIDTTAPDINLASPSINSFSFTDFTSAPTATWTGLTDAGAGLKDYQISVGSIGGLNDILDWASTAVATTGQVNISSLANGTYYFNLRARDNLLNTSSAVAIQFIINRTLPQLTVNSTTQIINTQNQSDYALSGTCSENSLPVSISGAVTDTTTCISGNWSLNIDFTSVPDGDVSITATHGSGNINSVNLAMNLAKDATPPTPPIILFGASPNSLAVSPTLNFLSASDSGSGLMSQEIQLRASVNSDILVPWSTLKSGQALSGLSLLNNTAYYFEIRATDNAGNTSTVSLSSPFTAMFSTVTPIFSSSATDPTKLSSIPVSLNFNHAISGLTLTMLATNNASVQNLTGSGTSYNFDLVPIAEGPLSVSLAASQVSDAWGNANIASNDLIYTYTAFANQCQSGMGVVLQISSGANHSCAIEVGGIVKCWGDNSLGQLATDATSVPSSSEPLVVMGLNAVSAISAGGNHTCALEVDGSVKCWGANQNGQLGNETVSPYSTTPLPVKDSASLSQFLTGARDISAGDYHTCALITDGSVKCWGNDGALQLGFNPSLSANFPTAVKVLGVTNVTKIASGSLHTCVILSDKTVKCWGSNNYGQLATGGNTPVVSTVPAASILDLTNVEDISLGKNHTCALISDPTNLNQNSVKCWGDNTSLQISSSLTSQILSPTTMVNLENPIKLSAGDNHTCVVDYSVSTSKKQVKCWGANTDGQLGINSSTTASGSPPTSFGFENILEVSAGGKHSCALDLNYTIKCWGYITPNQVGTTSPMAYTTYPRAILGAPQNLTMSSDFGLFALSDNLFPNALQKVKITDSCGNVISSTQTEVTLSASLSSDCSGITDGTLSATTNPVLTNAGVAIFDSLKYILPQNKLSESIYIKASAPNLISACTTTPLAIVSAKPTISLKGSTTNSTTATSNTSLQFLKPDNTAAGNLLIAAITVQSGSAPLTAPADWFTIDTGQMDKNGFGMKIFYKFAQQTETSSYTFAISGNMNASGVLFTFSGVDSTTPFISSQKLTATGVIAQSTSYITITQYVEPSPVVLSFFGISNQNINTSVDSTQSSAQNLIANIASTNGTGGGNNAGTRTVVYSANPSFPMTTEIVSTYNSAQGSADSVSIQLLLRQAP